MADKKIIDRNALTENNPNDDEEILQNDTGPVTDVIHKEEDKGFVNTNPKLPEPEKA